MATMMGRIVATTEGVDEGGMKEAVRDVHDFFLQDVVKKVRKSIFT